MRKTCQHAEKRTSVEKIEPRIEKTGQHAEQSTEVARSEPRTRKDPSARQENKLRGKE